MAAVAAVVAGVLAVFVPAVDEVVEVEVAVVWVVIVEGTTLVDAKVEVGAGAMTPVSGRSLTSDPAALTATYATAVVANVASSQSRNRELLTISLSLVRVARSSMKGLENLWLSVRRVRN